MVARNPRHGSPDRNPGAAARSRRRYVPPAIAGALVLLLFVIGVVILLWQGREEPQPTPPSPTPTESPISRPEFAPENVFELRVDDAAVDPRSDAMVDHLQGQIEPHYSGIAALNVDEFHQSMWVAEPSTPRTTVRFDDCQDKGHVPDGLHNNEKQFVDVPIPQDARPAAGTDSTLSVYSPSEDRLWEFWIASQDAQGRWSACWGGRLDDVSQQKGYFENPFGAAATGLVTVGSMVTVEEARNREIDHAMGLALLAPASFEEFRYPAQRSDGYSDDPAAIPEGARLRLDPEVDVDSLDLTPLAAAIARAAQTYGFIVVDKADAVAVIAESGHQQELRTGTDPWKEILDDVPPHEQLRNFPWDRMQVLDEEFGAPQSED